MIRETNGPFADLSGVFFLYRSQPPQDSDSAEWSKLKRKQKDSGYVEINGYLTIPSVVKILQDELLSSPPVFHISFFQSSTTSESETHTDFNVVVDMSAFVNTTFHDSFIDKAVLEHHLNSEGTTPLEVCVSLNWSANFDLAQVLSTLTRKMKGRWPSPSHRGVITFRSNFHVILRHRPLNGKIKLSSKLSPFRKKVQEVECIKYPCLVDTDTFVSSCWRCLKMNFCQPSRRTFLKRSRYYEVICENPNKVIQEAGTAVPQKKEKQKDKPSSTETTTASSTTSTSSSSLGSLQSIVSLISDFDHSVYCQLGSQSDASSFSLNSEAAYDSLNSVVELSSQSSATNATIIANRFRNRSGSDADSDSVCKERSINNSNDY